jgi:hypothetical protein
MPWPIGWGQRWVSPAGTRQEAVLRPMWGLMPSSKSADSAKYRVVAVAATYFDVFWCQRDEGVL